MLVKRTKDPEIDHNTKRRKIENKEDYFDMSIDDLSDLIEAQEYAGVLQSVYNEKVINGRAFEVLKENHILSGKCWHQ